MKRFHNAVFLGDGLILGTDLIIVIILQLKFLYEYINYKTSSLFRLSWILAFELILKSLSDFSHEGPY